MTWQAKEAAMEFFQVTAATGSGRLLTLTASSFGEMKNLTSTSTVLLDAARYQFPSGYSWSRRLRMYGVSSQKVQKETGEFGSGAVVENQTNWQQGTFHDPGPCRDGYAHIQYIDSWFPSMDWSFDIYRPLEGDLSLPSFMDPVIFDTCVPASKKK